MKKIIGIILIIFVYLLNSNIYTNNKQEQIKETKISPNDKLLNFVNETNSNNKLYDQLLNNTIELKNQNCTENEIYLYNSIYLLTYNFYCNDSNCSKY
jgi:hypothetical protein